MGAPKGNKYGLGNSDSGRPNRFSDQDLDLMANDLIEWSKTDNAIVFCDWYTDRDIPYSSLADLRKRSKAFSEAYEIAKVRIGSRREKLTIADKFSDLVYSKTLHNYDPELFDKAIELKKADASNHGSQELILRIPGMNATEPVRTEA